MPRGKHDSESSFGRGKKYTSLSTEEVACIGILLVVLAALLIIGCWYYKRRSGYKSLLSKNVHLVTMKISEGKNELLDSKLLLQEDNSNVNHMIPDAPPAYDKISASPLLPPPYAP